MVVEARRKARRPLAAEHHLGSPLHGVGHVLVHFGRDAFVVERAERRVRRERVAEPQRLGGVDQTGDELVPHGLLDQDSLARRAALPGAQVAPDHRAFDGSPDVRVGEHDHGTVAAEL